MVDTLTTFADWVQYEARWRASVTGRTAHNYLQAALAGAYVVLADPAQAFLDVIEADNLTAPSAPISWVAADGSRLAPVGQHRADRRRGA